MNQERDNDCKQRNSFDECGKDDRTRMDASGHFRLTRHAVHCLAGKSTNTDAGADDCYARADSCAELRPCGGVALVERSGHFLKERKE